MTSAAATCWIDTAAPVERVDLDERCWVDVVRGLLPAGDDVHDELARTVAWEQGRVFRYERWIDEPRLIAWKTGAERHPALGEVEAWLAARYRVRFDGVALSRYRGEQDSVAWHRDRELRWLDDTVIGVLSLGARRPWLMRPLGTGRYDPTDLRGAVDFRPGSGDLLVMGGACQAGWLHAVPKLPTRCRDRISAQWRWTAKRGRRDTNPSYYAPRTYGR